MNKSSASSVYLNAETFHLFRTEANEMSKVCLSSEFQDTRIRFRMYGLNQLNAHQGTQRKYELVWV